MIAYNRDAEQRRTADILLMLLIAAGEGGHLRAELQEAWNAGRVVPIRRRPEEPSNGAVRAGGGS